MGPSITPGRRAADRGGGGYALLILLFAVTVMSFGLTVALPVWETQMQRENEAELIFRGNQYVEAIRIFQLKKPGTFPKDLEVLTEEKCLRRPFRDPMTEDGVWNIVLQMDGVGGLSPAGPNVGRPMPGGPGSMGRTGRAGPMGGPSGPVPGGGGAAGGLKVMVAPVSALKSIQNPRIIGVVSASTRKSVRIHNEQESYDKWLFYFGQDPKNMPEIVHYGQSEKKS
jgi:type II secretory pathway pseudopilin PulG